MKTKNTQKNFKQGFTLLELLVVVLIIGILAAVAVSQYKLIVLKSRFITIMNGAKTIAQAAELYYMEYQEYPPDDTRSLIISELNGCQRKNKSELFCGDIRYDYNAGTPWHETYQQDRVDASILVGDGTNSAKIRYTQYLKYSPDYPEERHCVPGKDSNAKKVCESLGGKRITGADIYRLP